MADKNMNNISNEELEGVVGGVTTFGVGAAIEKRKKRDAIIEEAKNRMDPNDPTSWFQTVCDVFDEKGGI